MKIWKEKKVTSSPPSCPHRGDAGGCGEEGGGGGERCEGWSCSVRLLSALADAVQPHDWLPCCRDIDRHQSG